MFFAVLPPMPAGRVTIVADAPNQSAQVVAPHAGAPGQSAAAASAVPPTGLRAPRSLNGGTLPSRQGPGGVNHAPTQGPKPGSYKKPIDAD